MMLILTLLLSLPLGFTKTHCAPATTVKDEPTFNIEFVKCDHCANAWAYPQATKEELSDTRAKAKAAPKATSAKSKAKPKKTDRSPVKESQVSPNPGPQKRVKGKQPEDDSAKMIEELRKVLILVEKC